MSSNDAVQCAASSATATNRCRLTEHLTDGGARFARGDFDGSIAAFARALEVPRALLQCLAHSEYSASVGCTPTLDFDVNKISADADIRRDSDPNCSNNMCISSF